MKKHALVTGASDGIGRVFAQKLAKQGWTVTAVARTESRLKELVSELGEGHSFLVADLSSSAGQAKVVQAIEGKHFDLVVNNAGVGTLGKFTEVALDRQLAMMRLNCEALVTLSHAYLKTAKSGDALINVSSCLAFLPMPGIGLYSATKAFVTSFSESLWWEQKARGIYVMGLCPGITSTSFRKNAGGDGTITGRQSGPAQTPEQVVDRALKALRARKSPTVISGLSNAIFTGLTRFLPRRSTVNLLGSASPK
jgi:uncharacterized protein